MSTSSIPTTLTVHRLVAGRNQAIPQDRRAYIHICCAFEAEPNLLADCTAHQGLRLMTTGRSYPVSTKPGRSNPKPPVPRSSLFQGNRAEASGIR
jgi:hypothetical protein